MISENVAGLSDHIKLLNDLLNWNHEWEKHLYLCIFLIFYIMLVVRVLIAPWVGEKRIFNRSECQAHFAELTIKLT